MKKLISIMAACLLVFGFAGMASAATGNYCAQCEGDDPGVIDRGCEAGQFRSCYPFDYEDVTDYCDYEKDEYHRAIFELCDCYPDLSIGDTIYVSMEIMVDKGTGTAVVGDNGVYWAEDVGTIIPAEAFKNQTDVCNDTSELPDYGFEGEFAYLLANGNAAAGVYTGSDCAVPDNMRAVKIEPVPGENDGYTLTEAGKATLWIDIPEMRADPSRVMKGWKVYVKICIDKDVDTICGSADCCCLIYIGELCCDEEFSEGSLIFPYFTAADSGWWSGIAITNVGSADGTVMLTLYEQDGDAFETAEAITVPANSMVVYNMVALYGLDWNTVKSVDGTAGNARFYVEAAGDFPMMGFGMMAKTATGESMGYLAMPKWLATGIMPK